ncbi:hypothetical protein [Allocoleopsis franciscana]|uniref:Uncharacterized protein n=1 Tax=Allocoleopsis franciscana PCC 7113 TaxID=1173027 RepID=K9WKP1_9CYAN|nr:hypothetical protein [Allocoleopsis franciscana]AFZ20386.1 hypothetical protein Mic7113_4713 [Allocoleopsis franciscana PCC 7113]
MRKLSETVYSSLFWLISGLLVWLVILPVALMGLPLVILGKVAGQILFQVPQANLVNEKKGSLIHPESQPQNAVQPIFTTLLLKTLIEVPAVLAAVVSLQPKRFLKGEPVQAQPVQIKAVNLPGESSTGMSEVSAEGKTTET